MRVKNQRANKSNYSFTFFFTSFTTAKFSLTISSLISNVVRPFFHFSINFFIFLSLSASAFDDFLITDIRIIGLQRVSIGSIFTAIPVSVGDTMNQEKISDITRALFSTGQFNDIQIARDGNALILSVLERPSVALIEPNLKAVYNLTIL